MTLTASKLYDLTRGRFSLNIQTENAAGEKPCQIDGQWCDDEEIKEEIFVILGERPTDDVLKIYKK